LQGRDRFLLYLVKLLDPGTSSLLLQRELACFLPLYSLYLHCLFLFVVASKDYVVVYLHYGQAKEQQAKFSYIKKCYRILNRKFVLP